MRNLTSFTAGLQSKLNLVESRQPIRGIFEYLGPRRRSGAGAYTYTTELDESSKLISETHVACDASLWMLRPCRRVRYLLCEAGHRGLASAKNVKPELELGHARGWDPWRAGE
jgi:hypothetical protein